MKNTAKQSNKKIKSALLFALTGLLLPTFVIGLYTSNNSMLKTPPRKEVTETNANIQAESNLTHTTNTLLQETPSFRAVGGEFKIPTSNGISINFTILTEDAAAKTGTVKVFKSGAGVDGSTSNGNGITAIPSDKKLVIPATVTYNTFTYTVVEIGEFALSTIYLVDITLPNTLKRISKNALRYTAGEKLVIPEGVTYLGDSALRNSTFKVLKLPKTLQELGGNILGSVTHQMTIYLPYTQTITKAKDTGADSNEPFFGIRTNGLKLNTLVITENAETYNELIKSEIFSVGTSLSASTYEMDMTFSDMDGNRIDTDKEMKKLYFQSIAWEKQANESWESTMGLLTDLTNKKVILNDMPSLPTKENIKLNGKEYVAKYWGVDQLGIATIDTDGIVETSKAGAPTKANDTMLYVMSPRLVAMQDKFEVLIKSKDSKMYDGKYDVNISFNRGKLTDQLKTNESNLVLYVMDKTYIGKSQWWDNTLGYTVNKNSYTLTARNVSDTGEYVVYVAYSDSRIEVNSQNQAVVLWQTEAYTSPTVKLKFSLDISKNDLNFIINPEDEKYSEDATLPSAEKMVNLIGLSGSFAWDAGQIVEEGEKTYTYIFTPSNFSTRKFTDKKLVSAPVDNFSQTTKSGSVSITYNLIQQYTVKFIGKDGSIIKQEKVDEGTAATAPIPPVIDGYQFIGWDQEFNQVLSNLEVNAIYKKEWNVIYKDGNTILNSETVLEDSFISQEKPSKPGKPNWIFMSWFTDEALTNPYDALNKVTTDLELYVKWGQQVYEEETENKGEITFDDLQDHKMKLHIDNVPAENYTGIQDLLSVYDIYFKKDDQRIEVNNKVRVNLHLEAKDRGFSHYKAVKINDDGSVTEYAAQLSSDGTSVSFETTHLNLYGIVAWNEAPNTGLEYWAWILIALGISSFFIILITTIILIKKRKIKRVW